MPPPRGLGLSEATASASFLPQCEQRTPPAPSALRGLFWLVIALVLLLACAT
jgi:hypothetical protein